VAIGCVLLIGLLVVAGLISLIFLAAQVETILSAAGRPI
jgi:hypothetical protein